MTGRVRTLTIVAALLTLFASTPALAQRKAPNAEQLLSVNGAQGTEFYLAVPQNDGSPFEQSPDLEFYIATSFDTADITVKYMETGESRRYKAFKNRVLTLSTQNNRANAAWQIPWDASEQVVPRAVVITSSKPISVYVIHAKNVSSDGYLGLPTSVWGKRYLVTSYYDFREVFTWSAGFCIIAREDGTEVQMRLRGSTDGYAKTKLGKAINTGQIETITLNKGDCYTVYGDGQTRGVFDLTGTELIANKNIGLISFHVRTALPNAIPLEGRDHLIEMTPPVSTWGKTYVTLEYSRQQLNGQGRGDFFRVVAAEDGTRWQLKYYDKTTKQLIGQDGGVLNAGQFRDIYQASARSVLPYGVTVWTANKPIFVMQYSTSANWDGDTQNDPFMCNVTPREQFLTGTIFQTPTLDNYNTHLLNLVVQATDTSTAVADLKTLEIDGQTVWNHPKAAQPALLFNKVPGFTDLYYTTITFGTEAKAHQISSNGRVKFGGYIYGFGNFDSYGWPAASAFRDASILDTMPPVLKKSVDCGDWTFDATELRNIPDPPTTPPGDSDQVETGISTIELLPESQNYTLQLITDPAGDFPRENSWRRYTFKLNVADKSKDAVGYVRVIDYADNITLDTVYYFADKLSFSPTPVNFGRIRLGTKATRTITITNTSDGEVKLTELRFRGDRFKVINGIVPPIVTLAARASHTVEIEYDGKEETTDPLTDWDTDSLIVSTECSEFNVPHLGMAVMPRISVEDWDAGVAAINEQRCKAGGLKIRNFANGKRGTDTLVVTNISGVAAPFSISSPTTPPLPIRIPPGGEVDVREICFQSGSVGTYTQDHTLENNQAEGDSTSEWRGRVQSPGPFIKGHDFGAVREGSRRTFLAATSTASDDGIVYNSGTQKLTLTGVRFKGGNQYWPNGSDESNYVFKLGQMYLNGAVVATADLTATGDTPNEIVRFEIFFRPNAQTPFSAPIEPVFTDAGAVTEGLVEGDGILPQIATTGAQLTCAETPDNQGVVRDIVVRNDGTMPLTLSRVALANGSDASFAFVTPPATPVTVPAAGGTVTFPVRFTRPAGSGAGYSLTVEVDHDAVRGNGVDENITPVLVTDRIIVGGCSAPDIVVTDIDFGRNLANCDTPEGEFTISNTGGGSKALEVRAIEPVDADAGVFQIISITSPTGTVVQPPFFIGAGDAYRVRVRFNPTEPNATPWADRNYQARFHIRNYVDGDTVELKQNVYSSQRGVGYVVPIDFSLDNDLNGNESKEPGKTVGFSVTARSGNWASARPTQMIVDVIYDTRSLAYVPNSIVRGPELTAQGWSVSEPVGSIIDTVRSQWRFTLTGTNPLTRDNDLFGFKTTLLLSPQFDSKQDLVVDLLRPCLIPSMRGDSTQIYNCAITQRVVAISGSNFSIESPVPNPVQGGTAKVDFGVGIVAPTVIDLVNTNGQVVRTLVDAPMQAGAYTMEFPTTDLARGVYMLRMRSADFSKSVSVVIAD